MVAEPKLRELSDATSELVELYKQQVAFEVCTEHLTVELEDFQAQLVPGTGTNCELSRKLGAAGRESDNFI